MFVKTTNGQIDQYPYSIGQLRRDNPQTSFPKKVPDDLLAFFGAYPVAHQDRPIIGERTQKATQATAPTLGNGGWVLHWAVTSKTPEEIVEYDNDTAASIRAKRNTLLAATDYFALTDVTMDAPMTTYRQALRDITSHADFPNLDDADWPTKPA